MKKIITLALAVIMMLTTVLSLASCSKTITYKKSYEEFAAMDIETLKKEIKTINKGKLVVATSPDFAPYEFYVVEGEGQYKLAGFDMALAQYIADYLDLELEVIPMDFDGTLAELGAKKVDLSMAGYSPDPDRMEAMDFSDIYYEGGQSFCVKKGNENLFANLAATNDAQYQIGAQTGSIQMDLAKEYSKNADIVSMGKVTDIVADILGDKLDGAYIETAVAETYAKNYPNLVVLFNVPYDAEGSAVGVYKGNSALLAGVNKAIAAALADGSMTAFVAQANADAAGTILEGLIED